MLLFIFFDCTWQQNIKSVASDKYTDILEVSGSSVICFRCDGFFLENFPENSSGFSVRVDSQNMTSE